MDVSVDNEVIVNTNGTVEVAVGNAADVVVADDHALDITVTKKEYKIVGDEVYIAKLYDDAPQWMKDLVQLVVDNTMETESAMLRNDLIGQLNQFATSYVPLNQYTQSILDLSNADTSMHATLETLNSNFNDGLDTANSQIINLQSTKASKTEVATKVIETLTAQLATPTSELGATIGNLQQAIVDGDSANADSVTTLMSVLEGEADARASAIEYLNTYVGINDSGVVTGTGLLADLSILQKQNDGVIETYTGTYDVMLNAAASPTDDDELVTTAVPYATWKANEVMGSLDTRLAHIGDVYIKYETTTSGAKSYIGSYKFIKTVPDETSPYGTDNDGFTWALIIDQAAQDAYVAALNAQDLADGKRTVFSGNTVPTSAVEGDIWIPSADVNITTSGMCTVAGGTWNGTTCSITKYLKGEIYQYLASKWSLATKYSADIASVSSNLQTQLDGKVDTYYQATVPTGMLATNNGDYWYCTADVSTYKKGKVYKYAHATTSWTETADVSRYAFDTADGKASIFTSATLPNVYKINDLLIIHADNAVGAYAAGVVLTATATRTTGSFTVTEWAKKINDTEDLDAFISAIDPKVDTLQNQADGKIEYFFFTTYNQVGTVVAGSANEAAALVKVKAPWATTAAREQANGNVVYFKDSTHGYWYSSATDGWLALADTSMMQALKKAEDARTVADEKIAAYFALEQSTAPAAPGTVLDTISGKSILVPYYWYDTATSTLKAYSSGWVAVSLSAANNGDQLQTMVANTVRNTIDYYLYEYNSSATPKWVVRTPTGYVANSTWGVDLATELGSGTTTWAAADSTLENSLHTEIGNEGARVESKFAYNSNLSLNGTTYSSGFGLATSLVDGTIPTGQSEFWIKSDKFRLMAADGTTKSGYSPFSVNAATGDILMNGSVKFINTSGGSSTLQDVVQGYVETVQVGDKNVNITDNLIPMTSMLGDTNNAGYQFVATPVKTSTAGISVYAEPQVQLDVGDEVYSPFVNELVVSYYYRFGIKGITALTNAKICTIDAVDAVTYGDISYTMDAGQTLVGTDWYIIDGLINPAGGSTGVCGSIRKADGTKIGTVNVYVMPAGSTKLLLGWIGACTVSRCKLAKVNADTVTGDLASIDYVNTTQIDGGRITTGSIAAARIDTNELVVQRVYSPNMAFRLSAFGDVGPVGNTTYNMYGARIYGGKVEGAHMSGGIIESTYLQNSVAFDTFSSYTGCPSYPMGMPILNTLNSSSTGALVNNNTVAVQVSSGNTFTTSYVSNIFSYNSCTSTVNKLKTSLTPVYIIPTLGSITIKPYPYGATMYTVPCAAYQNIWSIAFMPWRPGYGTTGSGNSYVGLGGLFSTLDLAVALKGANYTFSHAAIFAAMVLRNSFRGEDVNFDIYTATLPLAGSGLSVCVVFINAWGTLAWVSSVNPSMQAYIVADTTTLPFSAASIGTGDMCTAALSMTVGTVPATYYGGWAVRVTGGAINISVDNT